MERGESIEKVVREMRVLGGERESGERERERERESIKWRENE